MVVTWGCGPQGAGSTPVGHQTKENDMKATEYIQLLQALADEHGDFECVDTDDEPMNDPEEVEGVFVLAEKS